jgi:hypothetical protein
MNSTIIEAIKNKKILELRYSGYSRQVEPHAYGRDSDGDELLRCYQTAGGSVSGERAGWKLLKVGDIYSLHLLNSQFNPRPNYKKGDKSMERIFAEL